MYLYMILLDCAELHHPEDENYSTEKETLQYIIHEEGKGFRPATKEEFESFQVQDKEPEAFVPHLLSMKIPDDVQNPFADIIHSLNNRKPLPSLETTQWTLDMLIEESQKLNLEELRLLQQKIHQKIETLLNSGEK